MNTGCQIDSLPYSAAAVGHRGKVDSILEDVGLGARFLSGLPAYLRHPISLEQARGSLRRRLEQREADFLALARDAIYGNPAGPYLQLLKAAGCEYGDLERLVSQWGLEQTLASLCRQGVYLSLDEFKRRRPVRRGSVTFSAGQTGLRYACRASGVAAGSGGSGGESTPVVYDFAHLRERAADILLILEPLGGRGWSHATWSAPGSGPVVQALDYAGFGAPPVRWFSPVAPDAPGLHPRYRWSGRLLRWGSLLARVPLPSCSYVPVSEPLPIALWMAEVLRAGGTPHLLAFTSSAVQLCKRACEAGIDLAGAWVTVSGEPMTAPRMAVLREAGIGVLQRYASAESSQLAYGCLAPETLDDMHVLQDFNAVIQSDHAQEGLPAGSLLISSLRSTAPLILFNVSLGDQGELAERHCGCPLEQLGWTTHLHTIRSYEKLTAAGMTFLDLDAIRVLEEVLPSRFGGGPTDYQLLEQDLDDGSSVLRLLVHPSVGPIDEVAVKETFLNGIGAGSGVERVMQLHWREAGLLQVERRTPVPTPYGKILHLHRARGPATREAHTE